MGSHGALLQNLLAAVGMHPDELAVTLANFARQCRPLNLLTAMKCVTAAAIAASGRPPRSNSKK
jgi:hypothetical protein